MNRSTSKRVLALALLAALCAALPASAQAGALLPKGKKIFFGVSDTGDPADFGQFSAALNKHPALIESFRTWGSDFPDSIERWQTARARPLLHITTGDPGSGSELINPRSIAQGYGDEYLVRLNKLFWAKNMPAYIRPLGEPNRCLNVYASYDCEGKLRDAAHKPRWYRLAFRRIYILVHGGGSRARIDAELGETGLPPLKAEANGLPRAPVAVLWSTLPSGSPTVPRNRPKYFYPGDKYVDWVGTDFYSDNQDWKALTGLYNRFAPKPFAIPEFGISTAADDPGYMSRLMGWVRGHKRTKMLVYYQDFGSASTYRIQNYPASLTALSEAIHHPVFPAFAPNFPVAPPPPPGGVAPGS
jgi:Glycosyl hydrolase family 26